MKILCGVAIVALMANIAVGEVLEYSYDNLLHYGNINRRAKLELASLVNPGIAVIFRKGDHREDKIDLYPDAYPKPPHKHHEVCQHFLGFKLDVSEEYFCNLTYFGIELTKMENDVDVLKFVLHMETDPPIKPEMEPLRVEMPVFKRPLSVGPADFEGWAKAKNVAIVPPLKVRHLYAISAPGQAVLEPNFRFGWLKEVLKYVVYNGSPELVKLSPLTSKEMRICVTSAIVLPPADVNSLTELFKDEPSRANKRLKGSAR